MSKVLLVVDMADEEFEAFDIFNEQEMIVDIGVYYNTFSGWSFIRKDLLCAKKMPEEISQLLGGDYTDGWNDCIDTILGRKKEIYD